jgi:hypothetical protein
LRSLSADVRFTVVAELPELWSDRLPERPAPPRQLYDRPHAYGVGKELERMKEGFVPPPRTPRVQPRGRRGRSGPRGSLRGWWAARDNRPVDVWHRVRCRTGHHDIRGGGQMQLGSRFVLVERRCIWCDAEPSL